MNNRTSELGLGKTRLMREEGLSALVKIDTAKDEEMRTSDKRDAIGVK